MGSKSWSEEEQNPLPFLGQQSTHCRNTQRTASPRAEETADQMTLCPTVCPDTDFSFLCLRFPSCQWGLRFCFPHMVDGDCIALQGCCNTASQNGGFKNKRNNRNPKWRCWQGCTAPETCREDPSLLLLVVANSPWHSSAPRYGTSSSASVITQLLPRVSLSSYEDTSGLSPL